MKNDRKLPLLPILIALKTFIGWFVTYAINRGRTSELLFSTPMLVGVYYIMHCSGYYFDVMGWSLPLLVYAGYWTWLLSHEKVTVQKCDYRPEWSNKDWWWKLDGWEFEVEVAKVFRLNGYTAEVTKKTGDGGADIVLYKKGEKYAVQCKHWKGQVPVSCMRELKGIQEDLSADKLIMIASSGITTDAKEFVSNKPYYDVFTLDDIIRMALRPSYD